MIFKWIFHIQCSTAHVINIATNVAEKRQINFSYNTSNRPNVQYIPNTAHTPLIFIYLTIYTQSHFSLPNTIHNEKQQRKWQCYGNTGGHKSYTEIRWFIGCRAQCIIQANKITATAANLEWFTFLRRSAEHSFATFRLTIVADAQSTNIWPRNIETTVFDICTMQIMTLANGITWNGKYSWKKENTDFSTNFTHKSLKVWRPLDTFSSKFNAFAQPLDVRPYFEIFLIFKIKPNQPKIWLSRKKRWPGNRAGRGTRVQIVEFDKDQWFEFWISNRSSSSDSWIKPNWYFFTKKDRSIALISDRFPIPVWYWQTWLIEHVFRQFQFNFGR